VYLGKIGTKAAFVGLLTAYDYTDRSCGGVDITSENRSITAVGGSIGSWSALTYTGYQIYYYDITVNTTELTSSDVTIDKSVIKVLASCNL